MAAPIPYGTIATVAGKAGVWLYQARQEDAEVPRIIRQALRTSLCRYDPCAPGAEELADRLEGEMWRLARESSPKGLKGRLGRMRRRVPWLGKHVGGEIDIPNWREELGRWVRAAAESLSLESREADVPCRSFPDAETLGERFPAMFQLELSSRKRMNPFRRKMLTRLKEADELKASFSESLPGAWAAGLGAVIAGVAGLGVAEIAEWSDPALVGAAFATAGAAAAAAAHLAGGHRRTKQQEQVRLLIDYWIRDYLRRLTDAPLDENPYLMLQEAIERESRARHREDAVPLFEVDREALEELRERLSRKLIPAAEEAGEGHLCDAMRDLADALCSRHEEPCPDDSVLHALHRVMVAIELAPPRPPEEG